MRALKDNDTEGLATRSINLRRGSRPNIPGKLDVGKAIYGRDDKGGGCAIFKTQVSILIVFYETDAAYAMRLAREVADHMEEEGH